MILCINFDYLIYRTDIETPGNYNRIEKITDHKQEISPAWGSSYLARNITFRLFLQKVIWDYLDDVLREQNCSQCTIRQI